VTAALSAAASIALLAPAATAAPTGQPDRLSGSVSCATGGTLALHSSVDSAGTEHGAAVVKGVSVKKWAGSLLLGDDAEAPGVDDIVSYAAKGGRFAAHATAVGAQSHHVYAAFFGAGFKNACVGLVDETKGVAVVSDTNSGLVVREGAEPLAGILVVGAKRHRYQIDFTIKDGKKVEHQRLVRTANGKGKLHAKAHAPRHLTAAAQVSVKATDLTKRTQPLVFTLG
jgi:hypothetical protein